MTHRTPFKRHRSQKAHLEVAYESLTIPMTPRESVSIQLIDLGGANPKEDLKLFLTAMIFISTGLSEVPKQVKTGKQEQKKFIQNTSFGGVNLVLPIPTQAAPASHSNNTVEKVIYPGSSETQSIPQYYEHV